MYLLSCRHKSIWGIKQAVALNKYMNGFAQVFLFTCAGIACVHTGINGPGLWGSVSHPLQNMWVWGLLVLLCFCVEIELLLLSLLYCSTLKSRFHHKSS